jgi:hypothetical protein
MQSRRLRASNLSNRDEVEASYNRWIYCYFAYFVYTLLAVRAFFLRSATFLVLLNWWTFLAPITAINTAVSLLWFQYSFAVFALVKVLASICRHCFFFFVSAVGASDCWLQFYFHFIFPFCLLLNILFR